MTKQFEYAALDRAIALAPGLTVAAEIAVREALDKQGMSWAMGMLGTLKALAPDPAEGAADDVEFPTAFDDAALAALDRFAGDWDALTAAVSQLQPMGVGFQPHGRKLTDSGRSTLKSKAAQPDLAVDAIKRGFSGWDRR